MMVVYCQEKESKITLEFDTFVFKKKKRAHVNRAKILDKSNLSQSFFDHHSETIMFCQVLRFYFSGMNA